MMANTTAAVPLLPGAALSKGEVKECSICYEDFCASKAPPSCCYCAAFTCTGCVREYMVQTTQEPHCPSCSRSWNDEFLGALLPKSFIRTKLKEHREQLWLERQRALLPGRQVLGEEARRSRDANAAVVAAAAPLRAAKRRCTEARDTLINARITHAHLMAVEAAGGVERGCMGGWITAEQLHSRVPRPCTVVGTRSPLVSMCTVCHEYTCNQCGLRSPYFRGRGGKVLPHACMQRKVASAEDARSRLAAAAATVEAAAVLYNAAETQAAPLRRQLRELQAQRRVALAAGRPLQPQQPQQGAAAAEDRAARSLFIRACPVSECRGFLSSAWKCGTCQGWACSKCHEYIGKDKNKTDHVCHPDQVASAQLLAKETKSCPKCAAPIFKIDGCDQMWCTACHSGFSWQTGKAISTQAIHNPHFFAYMTANALAGGGAAAAAGGGAAAAGGGGGCPRDTMPDTDRIMAACLGGKNATRGSIRSLVRAALHIQGVYCYKYRRLVERDSVQEEEGLAVQYLLGDISERVWKSRLQRADKRQRKYRAFLDVFNSYVGAFGDVMHAMCATAAVARRAAAAANPFATPVFGRVAQDAAAIVAEVAAAGGAAAAAVVTPDAAVEHCTSLWKISYKALQDVCTLYDCKMPNGVPGDSAIIDWP